MAVELDDSCSERVRPENRKYILLEVSAEQLLQQL